MLQVQGLSVAYDGVDAVVDVDLSVPAGEVLAVLGPSGCGKSTLLRAVAGLEPPRTGRVIADGEDVTGVPTHRRGFALMFQDGQLFGHLSVARNVGYPLRLRRRPAAEVAERVDELLRLVGLSGYADRLPSTLSGGEQQRVALARALAVRPRLLLLDEPLSALDAGLRERLAGDLRQILASAGTTAVLVTHDHEEAFAVADRMALLRAGRVVQTGKVADVWRAPADADAALFLGYARVLTGHPAYAVLAAGGLVDAPAVALRRSALRVAGPAEPTRLRGTVLTAAATPELARLQVDVEGIGRLDAVSPAEALPAPGSTVRLVVDPARLAPLPHAERRPA
ncbi:ABC transporter ATP-binding protein [Nocardioides sp. CFH 31398]|uniref:ABC transporter ATP-binding protein n=1 Tax=Nocardioides sp. CFH 31398 TaxID=2919579 RepID=UPI001F054EB7|nr:ABC transporter ATP-binding protein [Nocardioides sp. CFH 31398]MCH1866154.1 ABC transporter ATP-binding protein [Nocardioides sp. CFH 31398]